VAVTCAEGPHFPDESIATISLLSKAKPNMFTATTLAVIFLGTYLLKALGITTLASTHGTDEGAEPPAQG
jgi:hypothetical protein